MKKIFLSMMLILLMLSCTKDPVNLITGSWEATDTEFTYTFMADGTYTWKYSPAEIDLEIAPDNSSGGGLYKVREDSLGLMETSMMLCFAYWEWYSFRVDKKELELTRLENGEVKTFRRN